MAVETAKVCWCRDKKLKHVQTWRQSVSATMKTAASRRPPHADIYSRERRAITERLETGLHPHTPWRDPREISAGAIIKMENTPLAHALAGACVWLRKNVTGQHDCSADLLWCIVVRERCDDEIHRVATALKHAWIDTHAPVARLAMTPEGLVSIEAAAMILVVQCVTGVQPRRKVPVHWQLWRKMQGSGERMLWSLADKASRRAVAALR